MKMNHEIGPSMAIVGGVGGRERERPITALGPITI